MNDTLNYISTNCFELTAAALGIVAVFLQIRINSFYWVVSILNVSMYIYIYVSQHLYALMILMIYYVVMSVYGYYKWCFGDKKGNKMLKLKISRTNLRTWFYTAVAVLASFMIFAWALNNFTKHP